MVFDNSKQCKITRHRYQSNDECDARDESCEERTNKTGTECEKECNKHDSACNGVENHHAGEGFGGVFAGSAEIGGFDLGHDGGGVITDVFFGAVVVPVSILG